jgi:hypothetical protein
MDWKPLKDYSNEELYNFLNKNESESYGDLGAISSEILRRLLIEKTIKIEKE